MDQEPRIALVTGASRGIGRASAIALASRGCFVIVHYRSDLSAAEQTLSDIHAVGGKGLLVASDLTTAEGIGTLFRDIDARLHAAGLPVRLDILVNNAGVAEGGTIAGTSPELFDRQFLLNVKAVFFVTQEALKRMPGPGNIVNVSSVLASRALETAAGFNALSAYAASKAAVEALTRQWAVELGPIGILVNAVSPGPVDTDMNASWLRTDEGRKMMSVASPLGRVGSAQDIAGVVGFLASPDSGWTTGQVIDASGGYRL